LTAFLLQRDPFLLSPCPPAPVPLIPYLEAQNHNPPTTPPPTPPPPTPQPPLRRRRSMAIFGAPFLSIPFLAFRRLLLGESFLRGSFPVQRFPVAFVFFINFLPSCRVRSGLRAVSLLVKFLGFFSEPFWFLKSLCLHTPPQRFDFKEFFFLCARFFFFRDTFPF